MMKQWLLGLVLVASWIGLASTTYWTSDVWSHVDLNVDVNNLPVWRWTLVLWLCEWFGINVNMTYFRVFGLPSFVEP